MNFPHSVIRSEVTYLGVRWRRFADLAMTTTLIATSSFVLAQPAIQGTIADAPGAQSLFETTRQEGIGPRPFNSFLERLSSPVDRITVRIAGDNLQADGLTPTDVEVRLLDRAGMAVRGDTEVTLESDGGARVVLAGRSINDAPVRRPDADRIQPGTQVMVKDGVLRFQLVAPFAPEAVTLRVSTRGVTEKAVVRYVPDLREMIAVGLIEGQWRSDRFDPKQIVPVRENDGFDNELRNFTKEFNGGKERLGARAAMYLKGKVAGSYLLTLSYDSEKFIDRRLFKDIDPNTFYPIYGDSSLRGIDAQSSSKLYVRIDKGLSYAMWGDYTTQDPNPARSLSQYSRSLPGLRAHYEEGAIVANAFASRESLSQVIDEFPARGVSGPYAVSKGDGVFGSEKIEIVVRDRNQPSIVLKTTLLTRFADYEFEPFNGQILFRSPIPSVDDQLNPVSIRVTYEVDRGGKKYNIFGGDVAVKLTDRIVVGASAAKDDNPDAPYSIYGVNALVRFSKTTELVAEVAHAESVVGPASTNFTFNNSVAFRTVTGPVSGNAARIELRHSDETTRARVFAVRTDDGFNNTAGGLTGGRTDLGATGAWRATPELTFNVEALRSEDRIVDSRSSAGSIGADYRLTDKLTLGAGARRVQQTGGTLVSSLGASCGGTGFRGTGTPGYNVGYGISNVGNQQIDPATGVGASCTGVELPTGQTVDLSTSSIYGRALYRFTDRLSFTGELQRELGDNAATLYRVGADWQFADKTRLYARYELARQYAGAYGLGVGETASNVAVGVDTQYMQDGSVYSEYRLRDASAGREVQSAIGLRNGWRVAQGLRLITNVERTKGSTSSGTAAGVGAEWTASELWKASGRLEWRGDAGNTNYLLTAGVARKLDRDWSLIAREYLSIVRPKAGATTTGIVLGGRRQQQFQLGAAWRPVDNNKVDALGLIERKSDKDDATPLRNTTDVVSIRGNWHPSRPWLVSGRYAAKRVNETLLGTIQDSYHAQLLGARITYDLTNRWSVGGITTMLVGKGGAKQYAHGVEVGFVVMDNTFATLGYNFRGFKDDALAGSNYTNRGWVLGVRYKFDEDIFKKSNPAANRLLEPAGGAAP